MKPICCGLDVLQWDKEVGLGHLVPTLTVMKSELQQILEMNESLIVCLPLVQLLLDGIERRFGQMVVRSDTQLAAIVHPKFKLDWVDDEAEKNRLTDMLKRRLQSVETAATPSGTTANNKSTVDSTTSTSTAVVKQELSSRTYSLL